MTIFLPSLNWLHCQQMHDRQWRSWSQWLNEWCGRKLLESWLSSDICQSYSTYCDHQDMLWLAGSSWTTIWTMDMARWTIQELLLVSIKTIKTKFFTQVANSSYGFECMGPRSSISSRKSREKSWNLTSCSTMFHPLIQSDVSRPIFLFLSIKWNAATPFHKILPNGKILKVEKPVSTSAKWCWSYLLIDSHDSHLRMILD
jgi:hypothetical protein